MRLEKLSAIAELVSAVAIVVTLGYLAIETRQNTQSVQAAVRQGMLSEDREVLAMQMQYPFVSPFWYGTTDLTDEQKVQLASWLILFIRTRENFWLQYQAGVIDRATWETYRTPMRTILLPEPANTFWRNRTSRGVFDTEFVEDVNRYLEDGQSQFGQTIDQQLGFSQ